MASHPPLSRTVESRPSQKRPHADFAARDRRDASRHETNARKSRKLAHEAKDQDPSLATVFVDWDWDDSPLVDYWEAALDEYKTYHSLHARGEDVEAVIDELEEAEDGEEGDMAGDNEDTEAVLEADESNIEEYGGQGEGASSYAADNKPDLHGGIVAQTLAGATNKDEAMQHLMMSWYWAGYYTGLHEGKSSSGAV